MNDRPDQSFPPSSGALERAQAVSRALADAARRARFSTRARGAYHATSFGARRGARAIRIAMLALFVLMVVVPDLTASLYFGLIASDQFVSEADFTVSSGAIPSLDGAGGVTGAPSTLIAQDTQIISDYIGSRAIVEQLERQMDLREAYGSESIDWWARFRKDKPVEKFMDYWQDMAEAKIAFPSGIVTLTVRGFSPADAKRIADAVVGLCETLINNLNERMKRDTVLASEQDLRRAAEQLKSARVQMEQARNEEGLLDVGQTSGSLSDLLSGLQAESLQAQQQYQTQLKYVSETAPQMRVLKTRIEALGAQIEELKAQITAQNEKGVSALAEKALSGKMTKFASLLLEQQIAETRYASAAAAVEAAHMMSERKMLYLHQIVAPALPEDSRYPKRWLSVGVIFLASLIAWGASVGMIVFVRNHMA